MKKIISLIFILAMFIFQGLGSVAQEDPCQAQQDALNACRNPAPNTNAPPLPKCGNALAPACNGTCPVGKGCIHGEGVPCVCVPQDYNDDTDDNNPIPLNEPPPPAE